MLGLKIGKYSYFYFVCINYCNIFVNCRRMRTIWQSDESDPVVPTLEKLLKIITLWHGDGTKYFIKEIMSDDNCKKQRAHMDYCGFGNRNKKKRKYCKHLELPYSAIIALEDNSNPTHIASESNGDILIPQGCILLWRADFSHAGAAFDKSNTRLFIHILGKQLIIV